MRRVATLLGGLLLAGLTAPAAAGASAYPIRPVLDAFRAACPNHAAAVATLDGGPVAGWTMVKGGETPLAALLAFGREAGARMVGPAGKVLGADRVFRHEVSGETLYLVISGAERDGVTVRGCRLYDPGEHRPLPEAEVRGWIGRAPDTTVKRTELSKWSWRGGYAPDQDSFELFMVPADSTLLSLFKIDGLAIKADWVDPPTAGDRP